MNDLLRRDRYSCAEPEALSLLDQVYSAALCLAGDPAEAEELVVEAFTGAYWSSGLRQRDAGLRLQLYRSLARARREQRQGASPAANGGTVRLAPPRTEPPAFAWLNPAYVAQAMRRRQRVRRALSELPEDVRFTVRLADVEGFSCEEIADITGVTAATARTRLHNGHRKIHCGLHGSSSGASPRGDG